MADETPKEVPQPQTADPYLDHGAILALVKRKRDDFGKGRETFIRALERNILFYRSLQWVRWDRAINRWRPPVLPKGTPTPVTNIFASTMDSVISIFSSVEPLLNFVPGNPDEPEDRATADVSDRCMEVIEDEVNLRVNRQMLGGWVGLGGGAWIETGYDPDPAHGTVDMQVNACTSCEYMAPLSDAPEPVCPECGMPMQPSSVSMPRGKMYMDVVPLPQMFFDISQPDWTKQKEVIRENSVSEDEAKARWPHLKDSIQPDVMTGLDEMVMHSLPTVGPALDHSTTNRFLLGTQSRLPNTRVRERWYYSLPTGTYPQGLLAITINDQVAYAGPLPYGYKQADGSKKPFLNFVFFPQKLVPGTALPKTVADDVALCQIQRNQWESICIASGFRVGTPTVMIPQGSNVQNWHGEPGAIVRYAPNPQHANLKPEIIPGHGIPLSFVQRMEQIDKDIEELAATYEVLKGARPAGVSAGIALQILQERGMKRYGPLFILWESAWAEWAKQAIEIFREYATEERLLKIKGRDGQWEVQKFVGADLQGRVDVIPEAGSSMPRSTMLQRAEFEQAIALGLLNIQDPETNLEGLKLYGLLHMKPTLSEDVKNAVMENEQFREMSQHPGWQMASPQNLMTAKQADPATLAAILPQDPALQGLKIPQVRPSIDDHGVHSREHKRFAKSESFSQLPEMVQTLLEKHIEQHDMLLIQQMAAVKGATTPGNPEAGFLQKPPSQTNVMNTSSSGQRMEGEYDELQRDTAAGTSV